MSKIKHARTAFTVFNGAVGLAGSDDGVAEVSTEIVTDGGDPSALIQVDVAVLVFVAGSLIPLHLYDPDESRSFSAGRDLP